MELIREAIRAGDVTALRRLLTDDPTQANALINWGKSCQIWTAPLHYVWVSNCSSSGGDWEMDQIAAMGNPAHMVQIGTRHCMFTNDRRGCAAA